MKTQSENFYTHIDDPAICMLYFTLDSSRREPACKRASVIRAAGTLVNDPRISSECYDLASELMDVEQIVQSHIALIRETYAAELTNDTTWRYVLEKIEDQTLETKADILSSIVVFQKRCLGPVFESWERMDAEVKGYNQRFETFLFKLRTRHYEDSNREASRELVVNLQFGQDGKDARKPVKKLRKTAA